MQRISTYAHACCLLLIASCALADDPLILFDGKSTDGWTPRGKVEQLAAVDGELHLLSKTNVWVTTKVETSDFVLEVEARIPPDADGGFNSGIAFRCTGATGKPTRYQCEIDGWKPGNTGGVYGIGRGGWLYPTNDTMAEFLKRRQDVYRHDQWNKFKIVCQGPRIQTFVNDILVTEIEDDKSLSGYFGVQHHGRGGVVKFRNIRVTVLK